MSLLSTIWVWIDYLVVLPLLARAPYSTGRYLAKIRGLAYAKLRRDWREFCLEDGGVFERTFTAYSTILQYSDNNRLDKLVAMRCEMQSIEEWEGACIAAGKTLECSI